MFGNIFRRSILGFFLTILLSIGFSALAWAQTGNAESEPPLNKYYQSGVSAAQQGALPTARAQFKTGCELEKDARSCFSLATMLEAGLGGPKDEATAMQLYENVCGAGMVQGCLKIANKIEASKDNVSSKTEIEEACANENWDACNEIGASYGRGINGFERNLALAKTYYTKACEADFGESCNNLALMAYSGEAGPKDAVLARKLAQKSCDLKSANGCANFSAFLHSGIGGDVDYETARSAAKLACAGNSVPGCTNYGQLLVRGQGGPVDEKTARDAFLYACQNGNPLSCNNLGVLMIQGKGGNVNEAQALEFFKQACSGGYQPGCESVTLLTQEKGTP